MRTSELQPALASGVGEGADAAVVLEAAAVEDHGADALLLGPLGDELPHGLGRGDVRAALLVLAQILLDGRGGAQRAAVVVVDDLGVDVALAPEHREARPLGAARDLLPDPRVE